MRFVYLFVLFLCHFLIFKMLCSGLWIKWILSVGRLFFILALFVSYSAIACQVQNNSRINRKNERIWASINRMKNCLFVRQYTVWTKIRGKMKIRRGYIILWWVGNNVPCNTWRFVRSQLTVIVLLPSYSLDAMFHIFI